MSQINENFYSFDEKDFDNSIEFKAELDSYSNNEIKITDTDSVVIKKLFQLNNNAILDTETINETKLIYNIFMKKNKIQKKKFFVNFVKKDTDCQINNNKNDLKKERKIGRKRVDSGEKGNHNKHSFDNLIRKIKHTLLEAFRALVNIKIKMEYKIQKKTFIWEILKINQSQANNSKIDYNKIFLDKTLKEIFSAKVTTKNHCDSNHNKKLIEKLLKDEKLERRNIFEKLFNYKFSDLLRYVRGERNGLDELTGLTFHSRFYKQIFDDQEYAHNFYYTLNNFEILLNKRKSRNRPKKGDYKIEKTKSNKYYQ